MPLSVGRTAVIHAAARRPERLKREPFGSSFGFGADGGCDASRRPRPDGLPCSPAARSASPRPGLPVARSASLAPGSPGGTTVWAQGRPSRGNLGADISARKGQLGLFPQAGGCGGSGGGKIVRRGTFRCLADGPGAGHLNRSACGAVQIGMTKKIAGRSRRAPGGGRRTCRVAVRYTPAELAKVEAAAAREGLVTAAWLGNAGLALADPDPPGGPRARQPGGTRPPGAGHREGPPGRLPAQPGRRDDALHRAGQRRDRAGRRAGREKVEELDDATMAVAPPLRPGGAR